MPALFIFLILFVGAPLIELYFLIQVGSVIGALPTILLTLFTAILGGALVRMQGLSTAMRVRESMARGEVPAIEMVEGVVLLTCGVMLLLPGFVTDVIGFICLIPPVRRLMIISTLKRKGVMGQVSGSPFHDHPATRSSGKVLEGEYSDESDNK